MRALEPTKIIISAYRGKSVAHDRRSHADLSADLALLGVHFKEVEGRYLGAYEQSFVCWPESADHESGILALAVCYGQDCVLVVHGDRTAELVFANGARQVIGEFHEATEAQALANHLGSYTHDPSDGRYFMVRS